MLGAVIDFAFLSHNKHCTHHLFVSSQRSLQYFNDLPRFLEGVSQGHLKQKSCLHGDASLTRILETGSGVYGKFNTTKALNSDGVYDFGACTVKQLLFGRDEDLEQQVWNHVNTSEFSLKDDGLNPCLQDPSYLKYLDDHTIQPPKFDFILINDNTRNPGRAETREAGLRILEQKYVPWFLETGATPVFFDTHAYSTPLRNTSDFVDIPTFTSLTYEGYRQYHALVSQLLPASQAPRLAPVGLAFLTVYEEDMHVWRRLFHNFDHLHASPAGTFLTAAVIHFTLFGEMPEKRAMIPQDRNFAALWENARVMQEADQPPNPFPTFAEAVYLYDVADRVARKRHLPKSLILYQNGEAAQR